jgi:hypothetical protein
LLNRFEEVETPVKAVLQWSSIGALGASDLGSKPAFLQELPRPQKSGGQKTENGGGKSQFPHQFFTNM